MLRVTNVSMSYGADLVLKDVSFVLSRGERLGVIGANGSGKSTLLRIVAGELRPERGTVWLDPHERVAYLPQYPADEMHLSVRESLLRGAGRVGELHAELQRMEAEMSGASGAVLDALLARYAATREEFERLDGYSLEARTEQVLTGLDLTGPGLDAPVSALSGGNKTKLSLARLLLSGASLLLLDEPTNYLDLPALRWLERFVTESANSYLIVSHDRRFLDRTVSGILEVDGEEHTARLWPGTYTEYAEAKQREREAQWEAYGHQQEEIGRLQADIRRLKEGARHNDTLNQASYHGTGETRYRLGYDRRSAGKVARTALVRARKLERKLDEERIDKPKAGWNLHLAGLEEGAIIDERLVLEANDVRAGYDGIEVLRGASLIVRGRDRVALLGPNGSGKTTLLRCLLGEHPLLGGTARLGPSIRPGVLSQENAELPLGSRVLDVFRERTEMYESEARTFLHRFLFVGDEALKPVGTLSYGQRAKLALACLILSGANFLVLDEPTSHMDIAALEAIEEALAAYPGPFLLVTHDRYLLSRVGITRMVTLEDGRVREGEGGEEEGVLSD